MVDNTYKRRNKLAKNMEVNITEIALSSFYSTHNLKSSPRSA